eukprot:gene6482-7147_t
MMKICWIYLVLSLFILSTQGRKIGFGGIPEVHPSKSIPSEGDKKDQTVSHAPSILSDAPVSSTTSKTNGHVFSSFTFKGFAFSMQKSLLDWTSGAVGIKIPITNNFPNYDSKIYLPRLTAFVGFGMPASLRLSMTMSVPSQAIVGLALLGLHQRHRGKPFVWPSIKPGAHVKRLGLTLSCKVDGKSAVKPTVGAALMFLPGIHVVHRLLPLVILAPALALTLAQFVFQSLALIERGVENVLRWIGRLLLALATFARKQAEREEKKYHGGLHLASPARAWRIVADFLESKTSVVTVNLGMNRPLQGGKATTTSAFQYDLQPFFPFRKSAKATSPASAPATKKVDSRLQVSK